MKEEIFHIFQEQFKPKSSLEPEKVEYNEMNIFSEYQLYNLVFAKNELIYDDYKASLLLHLCWQLLEFNPDSPSNDSAAAGESPPGQGRINTTSTLGQRGTSAKGQKPSPNKE